MADHIGKNGYLRLVFENNTRTVLSQQLARPPFHVQRAIYREENLPDMAYLCMQSTSGGILGGDNHRIQIVMGDDTSAHIATQGATRIYRTDSDAASQHIDITLGGSSYLEFMPDQTIPYEDSAYSQTVRITIHHTATLVYTDVVTSGRYAMGESFRYRMFRTHIVAYDEDGSMIFSDAATIEPGRRDITTYGVMGNHTVMGTVYILAPKSRTPQIYRRVNPHVCGRTSMLGGASVMRDDAGVLVRLLGQDTHIVMRATQQVASMVREEMLGPV